MNLKQNIRRFFSLRRRANGGFTLIELIVVIAVLAILAGVAVPAYSGYVAKANMASDLQLLTAVNKAFNAAVAAEGDDILAISSANLVINDDGTLKMDSLEPAKYQASFAQLFQDNDDAKFKVIKVLRYNSSKHLFEDAEGGESATMEFNFGGIKIQLNSQDVNIIRGDNAFSNRGSEALLNDVGVLENLLDTGIGEDVLENAKYDDAFLVAMGSYAGMTQGEDETEDEYLDRVAAYIMDENNKAAVESGQIMFAASQAAGATQEQLDSLFGGEGAVTSRIEVSDGNGGTDYNATMANAALAYGMYTAYAQQNPDAENIDNFTLAINSDEFKTYYESDQGQKDLEAYLAAMNMISDNTDNPEITSSIINKGITNNTDLATLMKDVMSK